MASKTGRDEHFRRRANPYLAAKKRFGVYAAVRMACKLGIDFDDVYAGLFGKAPRPDNSFNCLKGN